MHLKRLLHLEALKCLIRLEGHVKLANSKVNFIFLIQICSEHMLHTTVLLHRWV